MGSTRISILPSDLSSNEPLNPRVTHKCNRSPSLNVTTSRRFAKIDDAQGFNENHDAALKGGTGAGKALSSYEKETGDKVVTPDNFLNQIEEAKKKQELPPQ